MRKWMIWVIVGMLATLNMSAAEKLELRKMTSGAFYGESMRAVTPLPDGESYAQLSADRKQIGCYSFKTGKQTSIMFDAATVQGANIKRIDGYIVSPDGERLLIQTNTKPIYRHSLTADYYIYTIGNSNVEPLSENGAQQTPLFSPDGHQIAFVRDNNIFLVKLLFDNAEIQVTKDGKRNEIINGIPDWVNEEEFGNDRAMVFTADGQQLVWVRYDESAVKQYSMQLFKGLRPEKQEYAEYPGFYTYKYPIAGEENAKVQLKSYDIKSRQTRVMQLPIDANGYIPRIAMTDDAEKICVFTLNRHQDCLRIYLVNPLSTVSQMIIEDKTPKYVKEEAYSNAIITKSHVLLPSQRDGWMHLYLYNINGQLLRQVEKGNYEVSHVYGYDEVTGDTYFTANINGATEQSIYVAHQNGKVNCLSERKGWNTATFSSNYKYLINTWSDLNTPPVYTLQTNNNKQLATLADNQTLQATLSGYDMGSRELFTFTTSEGIQLNGWMVKPANFDAQKKYPVVMYQYGGPGNQQVKNAWNIGMMGQGALMEQYLCQQGYICVCVDNRGTGGRGADFEKCTYLKLGELESRDQVETAIWLGQQSYVDKEHIAIWGWSYGGWNTLMSMSEGRPVFCAGIAIAPPTNWRFYDTVYTERFMRTPKENANGYDTINPIARAKNLHGALLLCHGMADDNVHFRNTAEYTEALVQADKDFQQMVYTNRNHSIYGGNTRHHLYRQCINFFNRELKQ